MKISKLKTVFESRRIKVIKEREFEYELQEDDKLDSPGKVVEFTKNVLRIHMETEEYLYMFCLDTKLNILGVYEITHGAIDTAWFYIPDILKKALIINAVSLILVHYHLSGDPEPSRADIESYRKIYEAVKMLDICLHDSIIIGDADYVSMKERGLLSH